MRKNRALIIDHDLQTCKDIKYNVDSETTDAYYTLTIQVKCHNKVVTVVVNKI